jgi:5-methylcytosine-specific restriction endonuclease McrA
MTRAATSLKTLVLNADFRPLAVYPLSLITARAAVEAVLSDSAAVVEEWDAVFRSPSTTVRVPKTIALREFAHVSAEPKFCRRSVLLRDRFCCQYCGDRFESEELTFDHVTPRSRGGQTTWENILMACVNCNALKRDSMPAYSARKGQGMMRPLKVPRRPTTAELLRAGLEFLDNETRETWGDFLYWSAPLLT